MASQGQRRDSKHRILHTGESIRANGKYQYKYMVDGKPKFLYSWRLVPTDPQPVGKAPCLSPRKMEKMVRQDIESKLDPLGRKMTVNELIDRYLQTRTGVKPNTLTNYSYVKNLMEKEEFGSRKIAEVKTSDAKLFLIKLQQDGQGSSTIKTVRGVLRPAFQMAMDDDIIVKNPFAFQLAGVMVNTEWQINDRVVAVRKFFGKGCKTAIINTDFHTQTPAKMTSYTLREAGATAGISDFTMS